MKGFGGAKSGAFAKIGRLVIINLQKTPLDKFAAMKINSFCDTAINMLMEKLRLEIPQFKLTRRLRISKKMEDNKQSLEFIGLILMDVLLLYLLLFR